MTRLRSTPAAIALILSGGASATAEIAISERDCRQLVVKHEPAPDVTYQPGVDVHGNAVAPADLNGGSQLKLPDVIYIPLEVLIQDKYGIPANSVLYEAKAQVGIVAVRGDKVYYEDQLLNDPETVALEEACRAKLTGK
jgi:hypothetical protein